MQCADQRGARGDQAARRQVQSPSVLANSSVDRVIASATYSGGEWGGRTLWPLWHLHFILIPGTTGGGSPTSGPHWGRRDLGVPPAAAACQPGPMTSPAWVRQTELC